MNLFVKYGPSMLVAFGIGTIATGVIALVNSAKRGAVEDLSDVDDKSSSSKTEETKKDTKDRLNVKSIVETVKDRLNVKNIVKTVKRYGIGVGLITLGVGSMVFSNRIYHQRFLESVGVMSSLLAMSNLKKKNDDIDPLLDCKPDGVNYFIFDKTSRYWTPSTSDNQSFIERSESYLNSLLQNRESVTLNDVYDTFGLKRTSIGSLVGWLRADNPSSKDGFIHFYSYEDVDDDGNILHLVEVNADGVIFDKI